MASPAALPLPGITFETVPPALADALPRMDIAAFVGFASSGPVHVPVAVEDVARFRQIFGPDAPLARDGTTGETVHAYLGSAVEAFFRNGGRRCWVVRVANTAVRSTFPLAGLVRIDPRSGRWRLGSAQARAAGSWADRLTVTPVLETRSLSRAVATDVAAGRLTLPTTEKIVVGDLLRLSFDGGDRQMLVTVATTARTADGVEVGWDRAVTLDAAWPMSAPPSLVRVCKVTDRGEVALADVPAITASAQPDRFVLTFPESAAPAPGDLLRLEFDDDSVVAAPVQEHVGPPDVELSPLDSPPVGHRHLLTDSCWRISTGPASSVGTVSSPPRVERLSLSVTVWDGQHVQASLDELGFDPRHPHYWAALPTDEELFTWSTDLPGGGDGRPRPGGRRDMADPGPLWRRAASPRFPLAGEHKAPPDGSAHPTETLPAWLPLGMVDVSSPTMAHGPAADAIDQPRLVRDGLATFTADLFVDPNLARETVTTLLGRAHAKAYLSTPHRLDGIHALLPIDEMTLVAVPDAVHPGWEEVTESRAVTPAAPRLWLTPQEGGTAVTLWWTPVPDAASYVVEQATEPDFADAVVRLDGPATLGPASPPSSVPPADDAVGIPLEAFRGCPESVMFRVGARTVDGQPGPWSNTAAAALPASDFQGCEGGIPAPTLHLEPGSPPTAGGELSWTPRPGLMVELEKAHDPIFVTVVARGTHDGATTAATPSTVDDTYHRVRYVRHDNGVRMFGPWSNTTLYPAPPRRVSQMVDPEQGQAAEDLLAVQRGLLRLAAARGDLVALLSLAMHHRDDDALAHVTQLTSTKPPVGAPPPPAGVPPLHAGELHALSHGALFHPWTVGRTNVGVRPIPPDGCMAGVVARRTVDQGAWASPGNQALAGVVALEPMFTGTAVARLTAEGFNVLARQPAEAVALTAQTLSFDEVQSLNVRRLLILLRRLVLREGNTYVFEPHGQHFRSMIRHTFETLLSRLYERGALVGAVPSEAFRVVADDSVNPPAAVEAGRFVVELWVAPAQPLTFLRVRLVQSGPGELVVGEG